VKELSPGWRLVRPLSQSIRIYPDKEFSLEHAEERILTSERIFVELDYTIRWSICDPLVFARSFRSTTGKIPEAENRLVELARGGLRIKMASRDHQGDLTSDEDFRAAVFTHLEDSIAELGLCVSGFRVTALRE